MPKFILLWTRHIFLLNTIKVFHHMSYSIVSVKIDHFHFLSSLSHYYTYNLQDKVDFLISNAFFILVVQKKSQLNKWSLFSWRKNLQSFLTKSYKKNELQRQILISTKIEKKREREG